MAFDIGLNFSANHNTATWATPTWDPIPNTEVVTQNLEAARAEFRNRGGGFVQSLAGMILADIELVMTWTTGTDVDYEALRDAFTGKTLIDMWLVDGAVATSGAQGLRAEFAVTSMNRDEPLEEGAKVTFAITPGVSVNAASWAVVP